MPANFRVSGINRFHCKLVVGMEDLYYFYVCFNDCLCFARCPLHLWIDCMENQSWEGLK